MPGVQLSVPLTLFVVVRNILCTMRDSLFLEELVPLSLKCPNMFIYPWLMGLGTFDKFLWDELLHKLMDFNLEVFPE